MTVWDDIMDYHSMSDRAILKEVGRRLRRRRLDKNLSQQRLADRAGLSRTTVSDLERGAPAGVLTLIQVLRALGGLRELDAFLPESGLSPLELARMKGRERQRASRRPTGDDDRLTGGD
jgi:transcriptional regulator with XRE-family HTH domain